MPRYNSEPAPEARTRGSRPNVVVNMLIMMGRTRVRTASLTASRTDVPAAAFPSSDFHRFRRVGSMKFKA